MVESIIVDNCALRSRDINIYDILLSAQSSRVCKLYVAISLRDLNLALHSY